MWKPVDPEQAQREHKIRGERQARRYGSVISTRPLPIDIERPGAWNRHFRKMFHYWRYGYSHPDEDLLGVIDAVGDALNVQVAALTAVLHGDAAHRAMAIKEELDAELQKRLPDFSVLLGIEARINTLFPPEIARRRQWVIRERFERVAAPEAYQYWFHNWFNNPPAEENVETVEQLLAAAQEAVIAASVQLKQADSVASHAREEKAAAEQQGDGSEAALRAAAALDDAIAKLDDARTTHDLAQKELEAIEAECALARAKADLDRKQAQAEQARQRLKALLGDTEERVAAEQAVRDAEKQEEEAQHAYQQVAETMRGRTRHHPTPIQDMSESRADTQTLLGYIHTSYLMSINREKTIRDLKRWLLMRFWWFLIRLIPASLFVWLVLWWTGNGDYWALILGLILIAAVGRAGATTSIIRRLQNAVSDRVLASDAVMELTALRTGKNEISLALMSSSIFALLMYAFFISGVPSLLGMSGGIFPVVATAKWEGTDRGSPAPTTQPTATANADGTTSSATPKDGTTIATAGADSPDITSSPGATAEKTSPEPDQNVAPPPPIPPARPDMRLLQPTAPNPYAVMIRNSRAVDAALHSHDEAVAARRNMSPWNVFGRVMINLQIHDSIEDAAAAQQQVALAAQRGQEQAGRSGDPAAMLAWDEVVRSAESWLMHLQGWDSIHEGQKGPELSCAQGRNCTPFPELATALGLDGPEDFLKLLLWAFIAGFAERFVPDVLDRIVAQTRTAGIVSSQAMLATQQRTSAGGSAPPSPGGAPAAPGGP